MLTSCRKTVETGKVPGHSVVVEVALHYTSRPLAVFRGFVPASSKLLIRPQPDLWTHGHNIFLYHHPTQPGAPILCDFGVEVTRLFEAVGEVYATETAGGEAAVVAHRGPYNHMNEAHDAIRKWMAAKRRESGGAFDIDLRFPLIFASPAKSI